jgi:predicted enzyme involved in methoxymalonyl-ACP biosynthesis
MSCRVLGRQVEPTTLNLVAALAQRLGARRLIGEYVPTAKNGMVRDHYAKLGFSAIGGSGEAARHALDLTGLRPARDFCRGHRRGCR